MSDLATQALEEAPALVPPSQAYLASPAAEAASVGLFALIGGLLAGVPGTPGALAVGAGAGLAGMAAQGIERGEARRIPWLGAAGLALLAAAIEVGVVLALAPQAPPAAVGALALVLLLAGPALARWAARFDRHEQGWRDVVRQGPPSGSSPLAARIALPLLPAPVRWLLLPVSVLARIPCLLAILGYQLTFSRLMPPACRYEPSCSRYGFQAYLRHGVIRGSLLTALRLLRCSPIGSGGYDPIPPCDGHHSGGPPKGGAR